MNRTIIERTLVRTWFCSEGSSHDIHGKTTNLNNYDSKGSQYVQEKAFKKMKATIFEKPGLENLKIKHDVEQSKITDHDVLIRVKMAWCKSNRSYYNKW